jgi:hypothetical protein
MRSLSCGLRGQGQYQFSKFVQPSGNRAAEHAGWEVIGHPLRHERAECGIGGRLYGGWK